MEINYTSTSKGLYHGSTYSAGLDLHCVTDVSIAPGERECISTGVRMEMPPHVFGKIEGRSGLAMNSGILIGGGVIDPDYRGEIKVILINTGKEHFFASSGSRIAQLIIHTNVVPQATIIKMETLTETERGSNGFGSTGLQ